MEESPKSTRKTSKHGRRQSKAISRQKKRRPSRIIAEVRECILYGNARTAPTKFQFVTSLWNISASDVASETIQTVSRSLLINIVFLRPTCLSKTLLLVLSSACCTFFFVCLLSISLDFASYRTPTFYPAYLLPLCANQSKPLVTQTLQAVRGFRPVLVYFFAVYHPIFSLFVCGAVTGEFTPCY